MFRVSMQFAGKPVRDYTFDKSLVTIGRDSTCDIVVDNIGASRRHAMIEATGQGYVLADLKSNNGTYVDGERILHHRLSDADEFLIGKYSFRFEHIDGERKSRTEPVFVDQPDDQTFALERGDLARLRQRSTRQTAPQVVQVAPEKERRTVPLSDPYVVIGKDAQAGIRLQGMFVPRHAGVLVQAEGGIHIVATSRALRVNGRRVSAAVLADGDLIECGRARLRFVAG
jgi:pSer/pThr/pTyr-binding forkhead associated (FHA) protein